MEFSHLNVSNIIFLRFSLRAKSWTSFGRNWCIFMSNQRLQPDFGWPGHSSVSAVVISAGVEGENGADTTGVLPLSHRSKSAISWNEPDTLALWSAKSHSHFQFLQSLTLNGAELWIKCPASHFSTFSLRCSSKNVSIINILSWEFTFIHRSVKTCETRSLTLEMELQHLLIWNSCVSVH